MSAVPLSGAWSESGSVWLSVRSMSALLLASCWVRWWVTAWDARSEVPTVPVTVRLLGAPSGVGLVRPLAVW